MLNCRRYLSENFHDILNEFEGHTRGPIEVEKWVKTEIKMLNQRMEHVSPRVRFLVVFSPYRSCGECGLAIPPSDCHVVGSKVNVI